MHYAHLLPDTLTYVVFWEERRQVGKGRNHLELLNCRLSCFWVKSCRAESIFGLGCQEGGAGLSQVGDDHEGHERHGGLTVAAGKGWP